MLIKCCALRFPRRSLSREARQLLKYKEDANKHVFYQSQPMNDNSHDLILKETYGV